LFEKKHVTPGRSAEVASVVVGVARPNVTVVRHFVPFLASDLTCLAANADRWIGEEPDLDVISHVGMRALVGTLESFADHRSSIFPCSP
jgi:hypothetical protein